MLAEPVFSAANPRNISLCEDLNTVARPSRLWHQSAFISGFSAVNSSNHKKTGSVLSAAGL
jgi:hypothetical protein